MEGLIVKVLIHNQALFNELCAFIFNFLFSQSKFSFYSIIHYVSEVIKQICKIFGNNISSKKYEKLRNYSSQGSSI